MTLPSPIQIVQTIIRAIPEVVPYLAQSTVKAAGYDGIRTVMRADIFGAVFGYLEGGSLPDARSRMAAAVSKGYIETADIAYQDAGAELPLDEDTAAWAREQLDAQLSFVDQLFDTLKEIRKAGDFDSTEIATARAEGYCGSLDSFYSETKMRGGDNVTLEFGGDDGNESCPDCQNMKGKRHRVKYILANNLVPKPGNDTYQCKGYECQHFWFNPKTGEEFRV